VEKHHDITLLADRLEACIGCKDVYRA